MNVPRTTSIIIGALIVTTIVFGLLAGVAWRRAGESGERLRRAEQALAITVDDLRRAEQRTAGIADTVATGLADIRDSITIGTSSLSERIRGIASQVAALEAYVSSIGGPSDPYAGD